MFTMDGDPHLIGGKVPGRDTYFFPKHLAGGDPAVGAVELEEVLLKHGSGVVLHLERLPAAAPVRGGDRPVRADHDRGGRAREGADGGARAVRGW
ncbi:MAG: hypothetical protein R2695_19330 [Acidimicrobiales bacterium]